MIDNDEPKFWLNVLRILEETDLIPSELEIWICSKTHMATKLAIAYGKENQQDKTVEEIVPKELHIFSTFLATRKLLSFLQGDHTIIRLKPNQVSN